MGDVSPGKFKTIPAMVTMSVQTFKSIPKKRAGSCNGFTACLEGASEFGAGSFNLPGDCQNVTMVLHAKIFPMQILKTHVNRVFPKRNELVQLLCCFYK